MDSIGIIGRGFVGGAIERFLKENSNRDVISYDISDDLPADMGYKKVVANCGIIYLCVPTPMDSEGRCYTGIVNDALRLLSYHAGKLNKMPIVLIKSTLVPGTTVSEFVGRSFKNVIIVNNPEFLTERNAYEDFKNSKRHLFGLRNAENNPVSVLLESYHKELWPDAKCIFVENTQAELIKYTTNTYFSVKVTFANHMYQLCQSLNIDYSEYINKAIEVDPRIEPTHWQVPGPDGKLGFGGSCFPKDLNGMITLFKDSGVDAPLLQITKDYNNQVRPEKDWEVLKGRAVLK